MASSFKPQPTITLYRGFQGTGAYVWSPFVTKLEARLRFAGISYRTEAGSLQKAPRGKIPYISIVKPDAAPTTLADSTLITEKFIEDGVVDDLNAKLSPAEKAHDLALRALLEEKLYFYQNYERWHENYYTMRPVVLAALPYPLQLIVGLLAYRKVMTTLRGQGTLRYTADEIRASRQQIWESVNALLVASRDKRKEATYWVLGGNEPTEADATLFGFIASALVCDAGPDSQQVVRSFPTVTEYARAIHDRYFPDYALWN